MTAALVTVPLHSSLDRFALRLEAPLVGYPALELVIVMNVIES